MCAGCLKVFEPLGRPFIVWVLLLFWFPCLYDFGGILQKMNVTYGHSYREFNRVEFIMCIHEETNIYMLY